MNNALKIIPPASNLEILHHAIEIIYHHLGFNTPPIIPFHSPAALCLVHDMVSGIIPKYFLDMQFNPDLSAYDSEIPDLFWKDLPLHEKTIDTALSSPKGIRIYPMRLDNLIVDAVNRATIGEKKINTILKSLFTFDNRWLAALTQKITWPSLFAFNHLSAWWQSKKNRQQYNMQHGLIPPFLDAIIATMTNALAIFCFKEFALFITLPKEIKLSNDHHPHATEGAAIVWQDETRSWFLNGILVPRFVVETPSLQLAQYVLKEKNVEVRKEMVKKIGYECLCEQLNTVCIDKKGNYELLLIEMEEATETYPGALVQFNSFCLFLKMNNPSTGAIHVEGVFPTCRTIEDALNWRNGTTERPIFLT